MMIDVDMIKHASRTDKARIRECFRSIPKQLAKENKKFQYSVIKKGSTASSFAGCLQWIEDACIIARCYNLRITELPLDGNAIPEIFKVYMRGTGLFISMLEDGTQADVLQGNFYAYKGAIFENLMADFFAKAGRKLYYYHLEEILNPSITGKVVNNYEFLLYPAHCDDRQQADTTGQ